MSFTDNTIPLSSHASASYSSSQSAPKKEGADTAEAKQRNVPGLLASAPSSDKSPSTPSLRQSKTPSEMLGRKPFSQSFIPQPLIDGRQTVGGLGMGATVISALPFMMGELLKASDAPDAPALPPGKSIEELKAQGTQIQHYSLLLTGAGATAVVVSMILSKAALANHLYALEKGPDSEKVIELIGRLASAAPADRQDKVLEHLGNHWPSLAKDFYGVHDEDPEKAKQSVANLSQNKELNKVLGLTGRLTLLERTGDIARRTGLAAWDRFQDATGFMTEMRNTDEVEPRGVSDDRSKQFVGEAYDLISQLNERSDPESSAAADAEPPIVSTGQLAKSATMLMKDHPLVRTEADLFWLAQSPQFEHLSDLPRIGGDPDPELILAAMTLHSVGVPFEEFHKPLIAANEERKAENARLLAERIV
jgi:hypothetical protein